MIYQNTHTWCHSKNPSKEMIEMIFRSSDDEEYEYGDDINSIEVGGF